MTCELILGGSRSGKSALAEQRAQDSGLAVIYLATATAGDTEMAARIAHHQSRRPAHWQLIEEPVYLSQALQQHAAADRCLLVDCLTLWLTNLLCHPNPEFLAQEKNRFLELLPTLPGQIILVSNEVGMGIVPLGELSRRFSDEAGCLNQAVARICERVTLSVAGLPYPLKPTPA
jgi:adenosylcobinamide kinase/adenosylcobinamide-phosphate guanylyltransferase